MSIVVFDVEIRDVEFIPQPASSTSVRSAQDLLLKGLQHRFDLNSKIKVHFDLDGYKFMETVPKKSSWSWPGYLQHTKYWAGRQYSLARKFLIVTAKWKRFLGVSSEVIGIGELDLETLVTGSSRYELPLRTKDCSRNAGVVKFTLTAHQICNDEDDSKSMTVVLKKIDISEPCAAIQSIASNLVQELDVHEFYISCQYVDPGFSLWNPETFELSFDALKTMDLKKNPLVIPEWCIKIDEPLTDADFKQASIHLVFWTVSYQHTGADVERNMSSSVDPKLAEFSPKHSTLAEQITAVQYELGRATTPILGNYDTQCAALRIEQQMWWNTVMLVERYSSTNFIASSKAAVKPLNDLDFSDSRDDANIPIVVDLHSVRSGPLALTDAKVKYTLSIDHAPMYSQLEDGLFSMSGITGSFHIGFPIPHLNSMVTSLNIQPTYNVEACLTRLCTTIAQEKGYASIPDWMVLREPHPNLCTRYGWIQKPSSGGKEYAASDHVSNDAKDSHDNVLHDVSHTQRHIMRQGFMFRLMREYDRLRKLMRVQQEQAQNAYQDYVSMLWHDDDKQDTPANVSIRSSRDMIDQYEEARLNNSKQQDLIRWQLQQLCEASDDDMQSSIRLTRLAQSTSMLSRQQSDCSSNSRA
jgi:hypothetical protein